ncbi:hypothetical protein PMAYCL1PPCAC_06513 [Pristionchus mayeri]|uniref:Uncharacterized protein n=1 Tax=Pristionchus mayeri TaxID=1317129 RepID=A0AAN5C414_9BILA|nr:hypothetical protein PMAYCL1PPCAC_06513 [Pristionchus mayeri]
MSLFPAYQGDKPSTSAQPIKKEEPEDEDHNAFSSFNIARAAKEKEQKRERNRMQAKIAAKKDKAAYQKFNIGDTSSEDECTMIVDKSSSEDDNTRRIYYEQRRKREENDQLEKRKRKNRERLEKIYGKVSVKKGSSSSDSDSSYRRRDRKRRIKSESDSDSSYRRERKKKKKSDKERDRYFEPEKPKYNAKSKNWHFLATVGVTVHNPDSYMMYERRPDPLLTDMAKTESRQSSKYDQRFTAVLGANYKVNKLFFPAKAVNRSSRVLDKPLTFREDPEFKFLPFPFNADEDFELSTVRCDKQMELTEEPTEERVAARKEMAEKHAKIAIESDPKKRAENKMKELAEMRKAGMEMNSRLRDDAKDEKLWMEFLRMQNQIARLEGREAASTIDRREAILEKALTHLPRSSKLLVERMKLKKEKNVPVDEINKEWKNIMNRMPNSLDLWRHRLAEMKEDSKQFNRTDYMEVVSQATNDLKGLLMGTMRSHKAELGTAEFLVDLMVLRVRMEIEMGFIERAISTTQALIECNVFFPPPQLEQQFLSFQEVWEGNLPLVGEPGGKGWFHYSKGREARPSVEWMNELREAADKYSGPEILELGRTAENEDVMAAFARHERLHEKYYWRPVRAEVGMIEDEEMERQVEYGDLPQEVYNPMHRLCLAVNLIKELGGLFYGKMLSPRPEGIPMFTDPIGPQLHSFGLLTPSLHPVPEGLPQFIDRMLQVMSFDADSREEGRFWMNALTMSTARIRTCAWFMALRDDPFDMSAVQKELNECATKVVSTYQLNSPKEDPNEMMALIYVLSIYEALNLFKAQCDGMNPKKLDKSIKTIVKSIVSKARIWSEKKSLDNVSNGLKKSIILVLATLLVRLPGSWDERKHRVQCVVMGRDVKDELSLADQMKAKNIVEELRNGEQVPIATLRSVHKWLSSFFGSDYVLATVIRCLFSFADSAKSSNITLSDTQIKIIGEVYKKAEPGYDHYEQFYMYYIQILKFGKNDFRPLWLKVSEADMHGFKDNIYLVREYIDSQQKVINEVKLLSDLKIKAEDESATLFDSLARLYAHRKQFTRIVASAEMQSDLTVASRVIKVYIEEAKRQKDPILWRYALNLAAQFKNRKLGEEVFTRAFSDCSWSRALHLDNMEAFPEGEEQLLIMSEKHIRVRGDPDHVKLYIENARNKGEGEKEKGRESEEGEE